MAAYDLIVCGGGVIGLSIALESAVQGWKVLVVDAQSLGRGASWAGAGILPAGATLETLDPIEQLRSLSHRLHRSWAERLQAWTGIDTEYRRCGGLYVAVSAAERATLAANRFWWSEHGIAAEPWSHDQARQNSPGIASLLHAHPSCELWYVPDDCRVRNPRHLAALIAACRMHGVELLEHAPVVELLGDGGRAQWVRIGASTADARSASQTIAADRICISSGAWSVHLLKSLGIETGILPVRGQMVLYRLEEPLFRFVLNEGHRYLVPREDGHLLAGSCEEEVGFDATTTESMIAELRAWAEGLLPELARATVERTWAGLRPGSFDSFPYLGAVPSWENVYIASGHFRHGLHWSTATAVLMLALMSGKPTEIDVEPFRVQRGHTVGRPYIHRA